jgi:hypothetical protein
LEPKLVKGRRREGGGKGRRREGGRSTICLFTEQFGII